VIFSSLKKLREDGSMTRRSLLIALMSATGAMVVADLAQKPAAAKPRDKFALANDNVKQLLLLLDTDKNGRISKQEWMNFMEAEFNKLDKDGNGELDPKELLQARISIGQASSANAASR
jgi:Ca2+-binding EF-hand superfamily protein